MPDEEKKLTVFICGPGRCEHEWDTEHRKTYREDGTCDGEESVCSKCGIGFSAYAMWGLP